MQINIFLIILGIFIVLWLYGLVFYQGDEIPPLKKKKNQPRQYRKRIDYLVFPFRTLYMNLKTITDYLFRFIVEVIFEIIIWGLIRLIFLLIRGLFLALFRIFD